MPNFWLRAVSRLSAFSASTILSGVVSVLTIPIVIGAAGAPGWEALAVGQAVGALIGIAVGMGWVVTGPATVAPLDEAGARSTYVESLVIRGAVLLLAIPLAVAVAFALSHAEHESAALAAVSTLVMSCGAAWFYIGRRQPRRLLVLETLPRVIASLMGILLLLAGSPLVVFAAVQVIGGVIAVGLSWLVVAGRVRAAEIGSVLRRVRPILGKQSHGLVAAVSSSVFISLPTVVVAAFAPLALGGFALADRTEKLANMALMPFGQTLQGWVPRAQDVLARAKAATLAAVCVGFFCGASLAVGMPFAASQLSGGQIDVGAELSVPFGVTLWATMTSQVTGIACLVGLGRGRELTRSAIVGAVVCAIALVLWVPTFGGIGAAWAVVAGEGSLVIYQLVALSFYGRRVGNGE